MSFLDNIHTYGNLHTKQPSSQADPVATMRASFKAQALKQIKAITEVESIGRQGWYSKLPDGTLSVSLRNGNTTLKLRGDATHIVVPSSSVAIDFYHSAINACSAGELDDLFLATRRISKK